MPTGCGHFSVNFGLRQFTDFLVTWRASSRTIARKVSLATGFGWRISLDCSPPQWIAEFWRTIPAWPDLTWTKCTGWFFAGERVARQQQRGLYHDAASVPAERLRQIPHRLQWVSLRLHSKFINPPKNFRVTQIWHRFLGKFLIAFSGYRSSISRSKFNYAQKFWKLHKKIWHRFLC